jgi:hypothetical protein
VFSVAETVCSVQNPAQKFRVPAGLPGIVSDLRAERGNPSLQKIQETGLRERNFLLRAAEGPCFFCLPSPVRKFQFSKKSYLTEK